MYFFCSLFILILISDFLCASKAIRPATSALSDRSSFRSKMLKQEPSSEVASTKRKRNEEASEVPKECPEKMFQKLPFPVRVSREKSHLMPDSLAPLSYLRRIIRVVSPFFQLAPLFYVEIPSEEIQLERAVGSGSFSNVFFSLIDGIGVACKIPFKRDIPSFSEEVNLLKFLFLSLNTIICLLIYICFSFVCFWLFFSFLFFFIFPYIFFF